MAANFARAAGVHVAAGLEVARPAVYRVCTTVNDLLSIGVDNAVGRSA